MNEKTGIQNKYRNKAKFSAKKNNSVISFKDESLFSWKRDKQLSFVAWFCSNVRAE